MTDTSFGLGRAIAGRQISHSPPARRISVMLQAPPQLPDLSVDFLTWLNAELRRHIEGPVEREEEEAVEKAGLVNRLKAYLTRA